MVILFLNDTMGTGGKERRMLELIKLLVIRNFEIVLLSLSEEVGYDYINQLPIIFITLNKSKISFKPFTVINQIIKKYKPDVIHSWGSLSSLYVLPFIVNSKIPFVNGFLADAPLNLNIRNKHYLRAKITFPFSDLILSNSKAGIKAYNAPASKSMSVYNGMDFNRFKNLTDPDILRSQLFNNSIGKYFIIGMVAAFEDRKDYKTLVTAAIELLNSNPMVRFLFIGAGSLLDDIKRMVPFEFQDNIIFLGKRSDVESIIQIFDIGVLLTNSKVHGEGISNSIIEYMALQKPVIATRGGGTDEIITDNVNGILIDAAKPDQLVSKIKMLINDKAFANKIAKNGYDLVAKEFNSTVMTKKYIDIYDNLIVKRFV